MTLCSQSPNQHSTSNPSPKCTGVNLGTTRDRAAPDLCLWKAKKSLYCFEEERQENAAASTGKNCFPIKEWYFYPIKSFVCRTYQIKWTLKPIWKLNKTNKQRSKAGITLPFVLCSKSWFITVFPSDFRGRRGGQNAACTPWRALLPYSFWALVEAVAPKRT